MDGHLGWEVVEEGYVYDEATDDGLGGHRVLDKRTTAMNVVNHYNKNVKGE